MMKARVLALSLSVLPLAAMFSVPVTQAEELMKWERIPLQIPLAVGKERVLFADKNVRVGFPPALNGKLRVQSSGGAVYLKADAAFPSTRLQLQDVENGEVILLDVTASDKGPAEPVRIVYSGDVTSVSSSNDASAASGGNNAAPGADNGTQAKRKKVKYNAPLPVVLTRYAAQSLYGPVRTVEAVPGIHPVNPHLPKRITTLYPSEPVAITPLGGWGNVATRLASIGGTALGSLAAFPAFDAMRQALPMVQAVLLMAVYIMVPLILAFAAYEYKTVITVTFVVFALNFLTFWWELARWLDSWLLEALYSSDSHSRWNVAGFQNSADDLIMNLVMGTMFVVLPAVWLGALSWAGVSVGQAIGNAVNAGSKKVHDTGGQAVDALKKSARL